MAENYSGATAEMQSALSRIRTLMAGLAVGLRPSRSRAVPSASTEPDDLSPLDAQRPTSLHERRLLRAEAAAGMSICNHTWSHKNLEVVSDEQVRWQLKATQRAVQAVVGVTPTCLRPPYGAVDDRVRYLARRQGLTTWLWNNDWTDGSVTAEKDLTGAQAAARIIAKLRPGSVVLMHDGENYGPMAAEVTAVVLSDLVARGWTTATLSSPARPGATAPAVGDP